MSEVLQSGNVAQVLCAPETSVVGRISSLEPAAKAEPDLQPSVQDALDESSRFLQMLNPESRIIQPVTRL
jgi:hypothetical protein